MDIVIDFDGTCVSHNFPGIGKEIGATPVLRELADAGNRLILFTMRCNNKKHKVHTLDDAVNWFRERDIPLAGIQTHPEQQVWTTSPKAHGDLYIDDRALGCPLVFPENGELPFVDWRKVREMLIEMDVIEASPIACV
jgi:hypothetical protein